MKAKVLIIGGGGREHALGWKLKQSPKVGELFFAPGNAGTQMLGKNIDIAPTDIKKLLKFSSDLKIDCVIVGPETPLEKGVVDEFLKKKKSIFGPSKKAARLETDKVWAIRFMQRHKIPHPNSVIFTDLQEALSFAKKPSWNEIVIKASGLAAGKGVILPNTFKEVREAIYKIMVKKEFDNGKKIIIQERLSGREVSMLAITDGKTVVPLLPAQDHKGMGIKVLTLVEWELLPLLLSNQKSLPKYTKQFLNQP